MLQKSIPYLKNKYVIAILAFVFWMLFFDRNSMINQFRLLSSLHDMEDQKEYYLTELEQDSIALQALKNNPELLERFAREKYLMKKDDEDIYLIIEEN